MIFPVLVRLFDMQLNAVDKISLLYFNVQEVVHGLMRLEHEAV